MEESLQRAENELASARAEHARYIIVALLAALEYARAQAVEDFLGLEDFISRLLVECKEGIRDIKAGFRQANLSMVDWSYVPEECGETAVEEVPEEGEVSGATRVPEGVVVLNDPEQPVAPEIPAEQSSGQQPDEHPVAPALVSGSDFPLPDQID